MSRNPAGKQCDCGRAAVGFTLGGWICERCQRIEARLYSSGGGEMTRLLALKGAKPGRKKIPLDTSEADGVE